MKKNPIENLMNVMVRLRHRTEGCPWVREQTFSSVAPFTIEEAYEVSDAIEHNDMPSLKEELGDLLLQIVFHSRMAEESGDFDFNEVAQSIADKRYAGILMFLAKRSSVPKNFTGMNGKLSKIVNALKKRRVEVIHYPAYSMMWR